MTSWPALDSLRREASSRDLSSSLRKVLSSEAGTPFSGAIALSSSSSTRSIARRRLSSDQIAPIAGRV